MRIARKGSHHRADAETSRQPARSTKTVTDDLVREDVSAILRREPVYTEQVDVDVTDGEVTLEGVVASFYTKRRLEGAVRLGRGVRLVHNMLRIDGTAQPDRAYEL